MELEVKQVKGEGRLLVVGPGYSIQGGRCDGDGDSTGSQQIQMVNSSAGVGAEDEPEESNVKFETVFGVEVVFGRIASYLNYSDLRALRSVSRFFFTMVRDGFKFQDLMKLKVTKKDSAHLLGSAVIWKNLELEVGGWRCNTARNSISQMLLPVTQLELYWDWTLCKNIYNCTLQQFLSNSPKLKSLILDIEFLNLDLDQVLKDQQVKDQLVRLDKLYLSSWAGLETNYDAPGASVFQKTIYKNLRLLAEYQIALTEFGLEGMHFNPDIKYGIHLYQVIEQILENSRESLNSLTVKGHIQNLVYLPALTFRILRKLHIETTADSLGTLFPILCPFLQSQPLLERLSLKFEYGFPLDLMNVVRAKSASLKALSIMAPVFYHINYDKTERPPAPDFRMSFLKDVVALEEFCCYQNQKLAGFFPGVPRWCRRNGKIYFCKITASRIMPHLPRTLKKLELTYTPGFGYSSAPWNWDNPTDKTLDGLPNLTHLSLLTCVDAVSDHVLQSLFAKGQLTVLEFSSCQNVTDACLEGTDGYEFGLADLKGLRKLTIVACPAISENGLVGSIKFQELRELCLWPYGIRTISDEGLIEIASYNPSLERISTASVKPRPVDQLKEKSPRLWQIDSEIPAVCLGFNPYLRAAAEHI